MAKTGKPRFASGASSYLVVGLLSDEINHAEGSVGVIAGPRCIEQLVRPFLVILKSGEPLNTIPEGPVNPVPTVGIATWSACGFPLPSYSVENAEP